MDEFYINLPEEAKDQSVPALIRHALAAIDRGDSKEQDIEMEHFYLVGPYSDGDRPGIYAKYAPMSKTDIKFRNDNLKLREQYVDSDSMAPIIFAEDHRTGLRINRMEQRLPLHEEQSNAIRLLRETADTLEKLVDIKV